MDYERLSHATRYDYARFEKKCSRRQYNESCFELQ